MKLSCLAAVVVVVLLASSMALSTAVFAQDLSQDPCGLPLNGEIGGISATPTATANPYGSGYAGPYGDYDYLTPTPRPTATPPPAPQSEVEKTCEAGRIRMRVSLARHGTYRTGDVIAITVTIAADAPVQLNFDNLIDGNLLFGMSQFELDEPVIIESTSDGLETVYTIHLEVRSFVRRADLYFTMDALYALESHDGVPVWSQHRLTTPPLQITTTATVDHGTDFLPGDLSSKNPNAPWAAQWLTAIGTVLLAAAAAYLVIPWVVKRFRTPRVKTAAEIAWSHFERAFKARPNGSLGRPECASIAAALRSFLECEPATLAEVAALTAGSARAREIRAVLAKCDGVVFAAQNEEPFLNPVESRTLYEELLRIIPRPPRHR